MELCQFAEITRGSATQESGLLLQSLFLFCQSIRLQSMFRGHVAEVDQISPDVREYNFERKHSAIEYVTPAQFEQLTKHSR